MQHQDTRLTSRHLHCAMPVTEGIVGVLFSPALTAEQSISCSYIGVLL